jgi:hypothetical protein
VRYTAAGVDAGAAGTLGMFSSQAVRVPAEAAAHATGNQLHLCHLDARGSARCYTLMQNTTGAGCTCTTRCSLLYLYQPPPHQQQAAAGAGFDGCPCHWRCLWMLPSKQTCCSNWSLCCWWVLVVGVLTICPHPSCCPTCLLPACSCPLLPALLNIPCVPDAPASPHVTGVTPTPQQVWPGGPLFQVSRLGDCLSGERGAAWWPTAAADPMQ